MKRREFISLLCTTAAAWPLAVRAQQASMRVIGFLSSRSPSESYGVVAAFRQGLGESGFVEGQSLAIAFRWADGHYDKLPALAAELVGLNVNVVFAAGGPPSAFAAKAANATIPIVFATGADPVGVGLVDSLNHPGSNVSGIGLELVEISGKALELLHELLPKAHVTLLIYPNSAFGDAVMKKIQASAASLGVQVDVLNASTESEIDNAFASVARQAGTAVMVGPDPSYTSRRVQIVV
jgi:putative tryptophan/tyrosine transport system substrate-binding protein